jgi:hypothetical protein
MRLIEARLRQKGHLRTSEHQYRRNVICEEPELEAQPLQQYKDMMRGVTINYRNQKQEVVKRAKRRRRLRMWYQTQTIVLETLHISRLVCLRIPPRQQALSC